MEEAAEAASAAASIVADPAATPDTTPNDDTVATDAFVEAHDTVRPTSAFPLASLSNAVTEMVLPTNTLVADALTVMEATGAGVFDGAEEFESLPPPHAATASSRIPQRRVRSIFIGRMITPMSAGCRRGALVRFANYDGGKSAISASGRVRRQCNGSWSA